MTTQLKLSAPVFTFDEMITALEPLKAGDHVLVAIGTHSSSLRSYRIDKRSATKIYCTSPKGIAVSLVATAHDRTLWLIYPDDGRVGGVRSRRVSALHVPKGQAVAVAEKVPDPEPTWTPELRKVARVIDPDLIAAQGSDDLTVWAWGIRTSLDRAQDQIAHLESKLATAEQRSGLLASERDDARSSRDDLEARLITLLQVVRGERRAEGRTLASYYNLTPAEAALEILASVQVLR